MAFHSEFVCILFLTVLSLEEFATPPQQSCPEAFTQFANGCVTIAGKKQISFKFPFVFGRCWIWRVDGNLTGAVF